MNGSISSFAFSRSLSSAISLAAISTLTAVATLGCGSPPPPAAPAPAPAKVAAAATPPPDLGPTPEPEGLIVFARAAKPSEALKVIGSWVQMPMPGSEEVGTLVTGEATSNVIDLDQPIDFALALHGREPRGAISAAVRSLDEAKVAFSKYKLVPVENGALRIDGLGKPVEAEKEGDEGEARVCELVPSFGAATTRLICAESEGTLREMAPWLARRAPRSTFPADVHVEVRMAPVRPLVEQMRRALPMLAGAALGFRRSGIPELDDAFRAVIDDVADFTSDADTVAIDAMIGEPQGTVTITSQFRSSTSLLARLAVGHPERAGAPPALFWKLPADSDAAYFQGGVDAADFEHARDHAADVLGALLKKDGVPDADRKAMHDAASHTLDLVTLRSSYAKGLDADAADKAIAAIKAVKAGDDAAREEAERVAAEKMAGWFVIGLDAPAARVAAIEKEWFTAWSRPGVAKWVHSRGADAPAPSIRMAALPKAITGKDAAHLEVVVVPAHDAAADTNTKKGAKKLPARKALVLHALVVPDGNASWLVFAADESLAVAKAKELLATTPSALASRPGLAAMKDVRMNAGGFVSARGLDVGDVFGWTLSPRWSKLGEGTLAALASMPDKGTTPILFQFASQPGAGASPAGTFTATGTIPKAAIEALVRIAMH